MQSTKEIRPNAIYAADVGSVSRGNFGWARYTSLESEPETGDQIVDLSNRLVADLKEGLGVALGFECPLFVPVPEAWEYLGKARENEGNRPFSAGAGCSAAITGIVQLAWLLRHIKKELPHLRGTVDVEEFFSGEAHILVWEAFVSGPGGHNHIGDAIIAARQFLSNPRAVSAIHTEQPLSLAGAALMWSGLGSKENLSKPCLVVRPKR